MQSYVEHGICHQLHECEIRNCFQALVLHEHLSPTQQCHVSLRMQKPTKQSNSHTSQCELVNTSQKSLNLGRNTNGQFGILRIIPALNSIYKKHGNYTSLFGLNDWQSHSNRSSGMLTRASLGSIVQNGKFSAGIDSLVRVLKRVDFPTFGNPTWNQ